MSSHLESLFLEEGNVEVLKKLSKLIILIQESQVILLHLKKSWVANLYLKKPFSQFLMMI